jgi:hypothetical protein
MGRVYTEISHFRAPYKNWPYLGVGADAATVADPSAAMYTTDANGVRVLTPAASTTLINLIAAASTIFIDNDNVKLDSKSLNDSRPSAVDWINQHLAQGKTIVIGTTAGLISLITATSPIDIVLMAVSGSSGEVTAAGPGTLPITAVLSRPPPGILSTMGGKLGPLGYAALAVVGASALYLVFSGKKRSGIR